MSMLSCSLCEERFLSKDALREHFEGHTSQRFNNDEEFQEYEIKIERNSDQDSDEESLVLDCVKEEEKMQGQQEEIQGEDSERRTLLDRETSSDTLSFMCSKCSFKTTSKHGFTVHMNIMHLNKHKCDNCPKRYPTKSRLANHVREMHMKDHLEGHASQIFDNSDEESEENGIKSEQDSDQDSDGGSLVLDCVKEEEQLQGQQEEIQCEDAKESSPFATAEAVKKHRVPRERESYSKERRKTIVCSKCSFKTNSIHMLKDHMKQIHLNKHKCDHCPKRYPSRGLLVNHVQEKHMKDEDKPILPEDEFFRITTKTQGNPKRRLYECLKCTFKNIIRSLIYRHIHAVHREALDELYKAKGMVLDDTAYHKCTECFYKTLNMTHLKQHIKTIHQKIRDFVCDLCKKAFSTKGTLLKHMGRSHISADGGSLQQQGQQREFTSFASSEAFKKPRVLPETETSSKIFLCTKCSFKTINKKMFNDHMNQVHLNKLKCDHCPKRYPSEGILAKHLREKHEVYKPKLPEDKFFRITTKTQGNPKRRLYECLMCTYNTPLRKLIYLHIRGVHKNLLGELYKSKEMVLDDAVYHKCKECFFKTLSMHNLNQHIKTIHQKRRDFVCDVCKKAFRTKGNLISHMKYSHISAESSERHKCNRDSKFSFRTTDIRELKREPSSKTFMCSKCSFKTISKITFKRHMNQMHLNKIKCDHCPKRYPSRGRLANHVREKHMKDEHKPKLAEANFFRVTTNKQIKEKKSLYECLNCTYKAEERSQIFVHIRSVHRELFDEHFMAKGMVNDDLGYHKCTKCFYKSLNMGNLKLHIKRVHLKRRDFACDLCKKAFSSKDNLIQHMKSIHISAESSELHKCSICSYKTVHKNRLKRHLNAVHLKIRKFTCDLCQMKFSRKSDLQEHIEKHHVEKNILSCNRGRNCSFGTTDKRELLAHIRRVHEKIQGCSCKICGKWYSTRNGLWLHMHNHSMEGNSLTCDLCQTTTKNKGNMYWHMKNMHLKNNG